MASLIQLANRLDGQTEVKVSVTDRSWRLFDIKANGILVEFKFGNDNVKTHVHLDAQLRDKGLNIEYHLVDDLIGKRCVNKRHLDTLHYYSIPWKVWDPVDFWS
jgi:hypothetical protein